MRTVEPATRRTFIGREAELARLTTLLDEAMAGRGGVALVAGEPGIGKTRLVEELAVLAQERGVRTLWGRCYEGEGAPAFWPWLQILRALLRHISPAALSRMAGHVAAPLAEIVPELRSLLPGLTAPPPLEPAQARFRLFDSITGCLQVVAAPPTAVMRGDERGPLAPQPHRPDAAHDAVEAVEAVRADAGLLLILDDLQWADASSLLLFDFLAAEIANLPLLLAGTYRGDEVPTHQQLGVTIAGLARRPRSLHLTLQGLDADQVARLTATLVVAPPPATLVAALARDTEGNPLFVTEAVRLLATERRLTEAAAGELWAGGLPPAIRGVIEQRLARIAESCRQVLTLAAVFGSHFDLGTLAEAAGMAPEMAPEMAPQAVAAALDEAEIAAIIKPAVVDEAERAAIVRPAAAVGRWQFTHSLVRQALYEAILRTQRAALHRRVAEALERRHGSNPANQSDDTLAQILYHFLQAPDEPAAAKALDYALACAQRAERVHAHEERARFSLLALRALERIAPADTRRRCEVLLLLGEAQNRAGNTAAGQTSFLEAARAARACAWPGGLARAAVGFGGVAEAIEAQDDVAAALLEEALGAIGTQNDALRARLLARLVTVLDSEQRRRRGAALSAEAVAAARRSGDPAVLAYALTVRHVTLRDPNNLAERQTLAAEARQLGEAARDRALQLQALRCLIPDELERGDIAAVHRAIAEYTRLADEVRQPAYQHQAAVFQSVAAALEGRFAAAEQHAARALALGQRVQHPDALPTYFVQLFGLRLLQGRAVELEAPLRAAVARMGHVTGYNAALALLCGRLGRLDDARREIALCVRDGLRIMEDRFWMGVVAILAQACADVGDHSHARTIYGWLWPYRDRAAVGGRGANYFGSVARYLGLLAATVAAPASAAPASAQTDAGAQPGSNADAPSGDAPSGEAPSGEAPGGEAPGGEAPGGEAPSGEAPCPTLVAAARHFEDAIAFERRMGARPWIAAAQVDYGAFLLGIGDEARTVGPGVDANALLDAALATAGELGLQLLVERVDRARRLRALDTAALQPAAPAAPLPGGLTEREAEVLRLVAGGATNKQIGATLYLSANTVRQHTISIYRKTGATGRAEATAWAARHGLLPFQG